VVMYIVLSAVFIYSIMFSEHLNFLFGNIF
jgi:hypothetical protein